MGLSAEMLKAGLDAIARQTPAIGAAAAFTFESQWPGNMGYGPVGRPRSATIVITRTDGGVIGA